MKLLLFSLLFFSSLCMAQEYKNYTKVTVCRLVNSDETGPCSIVYYAKKLKRTGHYIQAMESYNDTLAYNLLKLKTEAKTWNKEACNCGEDMDATGKPLVTNMFIVEVNSFRDTVFTTANNRAIFFPREQQQYIMHENHIPSVFTKDVTDFFHRDFATEISAWKMDFISSNDITLKKKPFYGLTRKEFEKNVAFFTLTTTDSIYFEDKFIKVDKTYHVNDMEFSFSGSGNRLSKVYITNSRNNFKAINNITIDGVRIGDSEEVLCNKYDNSTLLKNWDAPLSAIYNYYTYEVKLNNDEGVVKYAIRNNIIYEISIAFWYTK